MFDVDPYVPSVLLNPTEISSSEFKEAVADGSVTEISVSTQIIHGKMLEDNSFNTIRIEDPDQLKDLAAELQQSVERAIAGLKN